MKMAGVCLFVSDLEQDTFSVLILVRLGNCLKCQEAVGLPKQKETTNIDVLYDNAVSCVQQMGIKDESSNFTVHLNHAKTQKLWFHRTSLSPSQR